MPLGSLSTFVFRMDMVKAPKDSGHPVEAPYYSRVIFCFPTQISSSMNGNTLGCGKPATLGSGSQAPAWEPIFTKQSFQQRRSQAELGNAVPGAPLRIPGKGPLDVYIDINTKVVYSRRVMKQDWLNDGKQEAGSHGA